MNNEVKAQLNFLHMSPRKVRLLAYVIKGMRVDRAEMELEANLRSAAIPILKLLRSAVANAIHNFKQNKNDLYVKDIRVNQGPVLKRTRPRAFGRAAMIRKRMSHVGIVLGIKNTKTDSGHDISGESVTETKNKTKKQKRNARVYAGADTHESKSKVGGRGFVKRMFNRKSI